MTRTFRPLWDQPYALTTLLTGCLALASALEVLIADTGQGIAPADLPRLFEPFFTRKPTGTGLGLSIVQQIVHDHGGTITVDSHLGLGTTFTICLPLRKSP